MKKLTYWPRPGPGSADPSPVAAPAPPVPVASTSSASGLVRSGGPAGDTGVDHRTAMGVLAVAAHPALLDWCRTERLYY